MPVCPVELPAAPGLPARRAVTLPPADLGPQVARIAKAGRAPCRTACPIGVNAQGYVALIAKGRHREALALVRERNPLPGVCGRVCTHPCEAACRRGEVDEPVAICRLKRYAADLELSEKTPFAWPTPPVERDERVAVVGSGPAGLAAAYELRRLGYRVTVFEAQPLAGGLLRSGIPEYRLPRAILDYEIGLFAAMGIEIRTGVRVGRDVALDQLLARRLRRGDPRHRRAEGPLPGIPGEELAGRAGRPRVPRRGQPRRAHARRASASRSSAAATRRSTRRASRCASAREEVTIVYRRGEEQMPAQREEIEAARAEGVELRLLTNPVAVLEAGRPGARPALRDDGARRARRLRAAPARAGPGFGARPGGRHDRLRDRPAGRRRRCSAGVAGIAHDRRPHRGRRAAGDRARRGSSPPGTRCAGPTA